MMNETSVFKSGYVAVVGRPNVGKSTLINVLVAQKIAAVSPRPQTTLHRQLGILTLENAQIVFLDTPGLHLPRHKLGEYMNQVACAALRDADLILWLVDASVMPVAEDEMVAARILELKQPPPVLLILNKVDLLASSEISSRQQAYQSLFKGQLALSLSIAAVSGYQCQRLLEEVLARLPEGSPFFDADQVTDLNEREIAADLIREAALNHLREEVPHAIAVRIDEFTERGNQGAYIAATLFVEKDSQKGIVIGKGGAMLKQIGQAARIEIEAMSGRKVFLELRVKVDKNWRNNPDALRRFGFALEKKKGSS